MDLIDSQYNALIQMTVPVENSSTSLEDLRTAHAQVLKKMLFGCFLDQSTSSNQIIGAIEEIIQCIHRTCQVLDLSLDSGLEFKDSEIKRLGDELELQCNFLFEVFGGLQDSTRSSLGQFLTRFDFNQFYSFGNQ